MGRRNRLPLEFLHFNPVHCWPLVGQAVSPANPRWTRASSPESTPVWQKPGCFLYSLWSARSDSNDGGNDRNSRPAKTAARFVPGFGLRFWRSILSALSSAQGRGPEGESANARGSALLPRRKDDRNAFRSLRSNKTVSETRSAIRGSRSQGGPMHDDPGHDRRPRKRVRELGRRQSWQAKPPAPPK